MFAVYFKNSLSEAVFLYQSGRYSESILLLNELLSNTKSNFLFYLWKFRSQTMLQRFDEAITTINICKQLFNSSSLAMSIILPWEQLCLSKINKHTTHDDNLTIEQVDKQTDNLLQLYQHQRNITYKDILFLLAYFFVTVITIRTLIRLSPQQCTLIDVFVFIPILIYFYQKKVVLPSDIFTLFHYVLSKIQDLYHSRIFALCSFGILVQSILDMITTSGNHQTIGFFPILQLIILFPIAEEIFFRGLLYNYLQMLGKLLSWMIVTFAFFIIHTTDANYWHVILSLICLFLYDKEKTILAPIMIHMLNNVSVLFLPLIVSARTI